MNRDETGPVRAYRRAMLCGPCRAEWDRWLGYRLPRRARWKENGPNAARLSLCNLENLHRTWRDTIRDQQRLVEEHCAANHVEMARSVLLGPVQDGAECAPVGPGGLPAEALDLFRRADGRRPPEILAYEARRAEFIRWLEAQLGERAEAA